MAITKSRRGSQARTKKARPPKPPKSLGKSCIEPPIVDERDELLAAADQAVKFLKKQLEALQYDTPESRYYVLRNAHHKKVAGLREWFDDGSYIDHPPEAKVGDA